MAVLEKLLKTKLPSGGDLSKKLLKGKLFTKRGKTAATEDEALIAPPAKAEDLEAEPPAKPKKPSLAEKAKGAKSLFKSRPKGPEAYGGPSTERIAKALRRDQLEPHFDFEPPPRIFASPPEAAAILPPPAKAEAEAEAPAPVPAPASPDQAAETPAAEPPSTPSVILSEEEVAAALQAVTAPVAEEPVAPKPTPEPRSAAYLALKSEIELDLAALRERVEHRTGSKVEIAQDGMDLQLQFEGVTLLICQQARPLSEAELVNLLVPDEEEWQRLQTRLGDMTAHLVIGAAQLAPSLAELRRRTTLLAGVVVALLDLIPTCLATMWPLGASLIEETDFRDLAAAMAEPPEAEVEQLPMAAEEKAEPAEPAPEMATAAPETLPHPQAEEPPAPRA